MASDTYPATCRFVEDLVKHQPAPLILSKICLPLIRPPQYIVFLEASFESVIPTLPDAGDFILLAPSITGMHTYCFAKEFLNCRAERGDG